MKFVRVFAACALAVLPLLVTGCVSSDFKDIKVESKAHPKINFEGYSTYAWVAAAAAVRDPDMEWTAPDLDIGAEIVHVTNRELRSKGMREVVDNPEVIVMYAVGVDMKALNVVIDETDGTERMEMVPKGAVAIVMADPETRQVMWAGTAEAELAEAPSLELATRRLDYAITQMFKKAPF